MLHDHQHGVACEASGSDKHFHDNEVSVQHCHLCQITCSTFDDITELHQFKKKEEATLNVSFIYTNLSSSSQLYSPPSRGPPTFA